MSLVGSALQPSQPGQARGGTRHPGARAAARRRAAIAWAFMVPLLLVNLLVIAGPAALSVWYSFTDWTGIGGWNFVGFDNYTRLLGDKEFITALEHNLAWTVFFLIVPMTMALLGAFLLSRIRRFQMLLRLAYFLPYVVATVVSGAIWSNLLAPDQGVTALAAKLHLSFLEDVNFLGDPDLALGAVAFVNNWQWWGFLVVIYLAAMQAVEPSLYEAAKLDGANPWQEFRHITLPAIRPTLVFLMLMTVIWSFLIFDYIYILTQGGPGGATDVLGTLLYRTAFANQEAGYAASIGVVLGLISFVFVSTYLYLKRRGWEL
jgi:raffinose/stachyose/melibiose transport system permease protein